MNQKCTTTRKMTKVFSYVYII